VTLSSPARNSLIIGAQPTFAGTATPGDSAVAVAVYAGAGTAGTVAQQLSAPVAADGSWSVAAKPALADGVYTVQATQSDSATPPDVASSPAVSFRVDNDPPGLELDPPSSEPLANPAPPLSGVAGTAPGDAGSVVLIVYPGVNTLRSPVAYGSAPVAADGSYTIASGTALPDGVYTVVTAQSVPNAVVFSAPVTIGINAVPPALSLVFPAGGGSLSQTAEVFRGTAGAAYGDLAQVTLTVYRGTVAAGRPAGALTVTRVGTAWQAIWPQRLPLGIYTVSVAQGDLGGATTVLTSHFLVVPPPSVIGRPVQVSQSGLVSVPVGCLAATGTCNGQVQVITRRRLRFGGHRTRLRLLSARFAIAAGTQRIVSGRMPYAVLRTLRRDGPQAVTITVTMSAPAATFTAARTVRVGQ
jgi:hypothetical protein